MDFLQATGSDTIRPFRDSPLEVRRRWYPVPEGTPLLGVPSAFLSARYQAFPWFPRNVGEVYPSRWAPVKNPTPPGLTFNHVCGSPEDFAIGQVFDPTLDVDYDEFWIPLCCGRVTMCEQEECGSVPVNGADAAQHYSYPIKAVDATDTTPVVIAQVALNQGNHVPPWPGTLTGYYPNGRAGDASVSQLQVSDDAGNLQLQTNTVRFGPDTAITQEWSLAGYSLTAELGGVSGSAQLQIIGGVLKLIGSNFEVDPSVLPDDTSYRQALVLTGAGNVQAGATVIPSGSAALKRLNALNDSFVLSSDPAGMVDVRNIDTNVLRVFPPPGEYIGNHAVNAPFFLAADGTVPIPLAWRLTRTVDDGTGVARWLADAYYPQGLVGGTVTSVALSTTSTGLTVGGGPITGSGTLTVNLDADLNALAALAGTNTIYYRSGASTWSAVTIGANLTFAGGTLSAAAPGTGTVTSVGISTTSTGVTVGVTNPTTSPALTVNLAVAIQDVVAVASVAGIIAGDGAGGLLTVTPGAYLAYAAGTLNVTPPTATSGQLVCAAFAITGASGAFQATGNTFAIAAAGTYLVTCSIRGTVQPNAVGYHLVQVQLRNNTAGAFVASSETMVAESNVNAGVQSGTAALTRIVTIAGATTFELYASRTGTAWTISTIDSDAFGRTVIDWVKLAN